MRHTHDSAEQALRSIASGHENVMRAIWKDFPSPYEIDMQDEEALRCLLERVVSAARGHS